MYLGLVSVQREEDALSVFIYADSVSVDCVTYCHTVLSLEKVDLMKMLVKCLRSPLPALSNISFHWSHVSSHVTNVSTVSRGTRLALLSAKYSTVFTSYS